MFRDCFDLETLDVSNWNVSKVTTFSFMFRGTANKGDMKLQNLDVSKWQPTSVTDMLSMFQSCAQLTAMDLSNWNMPNLVNAGHVFADCWKLTEVKMSGWNTPSLQTLDAMFNHCKALKTVDLSDIDTANVKELSQMFEGCYALETVEGMENWNTSKVCTFTQMFNDCGNLKKLDWSKFDTSSAYDNYYDLNNSYSNAFAPIFSGVNSLEKLIVSDKISYYGNGNVSEGNKLVFPNPKAKEGYIAMWRNVDTGELYLGKDIPEKVAATYEAYYQYIP
jgi:surface protein